VKPDLRANKNDYKKVVTFQGVYVQHCAFVVYVIDERKMLFYSKILFE